MRSSVIYVRRRYLHKILFPSRVGHGAPGTRLPRQHPGARGTVARGRNSARPTARPGEARSMRTLPRSNSTHHNLGFSVVTRVRRLCLALDTVRPDSDTNTDVCRLTISPPNKSPRWLSDRGATRWRRSPNEAKEPRRGVRRLALHAPIAHTPRHRRHVARRLPKQL